MNFKLSCLVLALCIFQLAYSSNWGNDHYGGYKQGKYVDKERDYGHGPSRYHSGYGKKSHDRVWVQNVNDNKNDNEGQTYSENESKNDNWNINDLISWIQKLKAEYEHY
ncbi:unnamed protein product [Brachionus calyciflorus]|uniref:Uncharacterized protein n=1 Tax=Brachionus calyciflorus TaxID=104777 RepID=A0A813SNX1_9BILA|nr:unnamed protein product [Brachionus calyciflorus]